MPELRIDDSFYHFCIASRVFNYEYSLTHLFGHDINKRIKTLKYASRSEDSELINEEVKKKEIPRIPISKHRTNEIDELEITTIHLSFSLDLSQKRRKRRDFQGNATSSDNSPNDRLEDAKNRESWGRGRRGVPA